MSSIKTPDTKLFYNKWCLHPTADDARSNDQAWSGKEEANLLINQTQHKYLNTTTLKKGRQPHFGKFSDSIIGIGATAFSPMYTRIFKQYWDNTFYARMKRNYYYSSFEDGILEYYIPTFMDVEQNMKYHRIVITVIPELDQETFMGEAEKLNRNHFTLGPAGTVDSTTIAIIAPKLKKRGFIRSRRLKGNVLACPIISKVPEIAMRRLLQILQGFYEGRIKAMISAFNLDRCLSTWRGSLNSTLLYIINSILEKISSDIANGLRCLLHSLNWLSYKLKELIGQMANQTNIMRLIETISVYKPLFEGLKAKRNSFELEHNAPLLSSLIELSSYVPWS